MGKIKAILNKDVVYVYKTSQKSIVFNIGLYIITIVGMFLSWYLTDYVIFSFATMY